MLLDLLPLYEVSTGPEAPPPVVSLGNAVGTYYAEPVYVATPKRCTCGVRPSKVCPLHRQPIEARQRIEDELLELALV